MSSNREVANDADTYEHKGSDRSATYGSFSGSEGAHARAFMIEAANCFFDAPKGESPYAAFTRIREETKEHVPSKITGGVKLDRDSDGKKFSLFALTLMLPRDMSPKYVTQVAERINEEFSTQNYRDQNRFSTTTTGISPPMRQNETDFWSIDLTIKARVSDSQAMKAYEEFLLQSDATLGKDFFDADRLKQKIATADAEEVISNILQDMQVKNWQLVEQDLATAELNIVSGPDYNGGERVSHIKSSMDF